MKKFFIYLMIGGGVFFICIDTAFAYLDPGTGSMILQAILGTFLFIGTAIGIFWQRIKEFFTGSKKNSKNE
ncbi:MAG: hypothetical protein K8S13_23205 [Desulfobacula sp.]|uniref:hypothetical protein n=1 Tax=Desulfobacula sp. TaxID=2593537 RepID=UPI0025BB217E|nr:hypothetical protein [Desulfobacula sp.]MCD4722738.1 hypothetical protein [Desulfobacula sp.]